MSDLPSQNKDKTEPIESAKDEEVKSGAESRIKEEMQGMSSSKDEQAPLDVQKLNKAIDILVNLQANDTFKCAKPTKYISRNSLKTEDITYFMEKTGEKREESEKFIDSVDGNLKEAMKLWINTEPGCLGKPRKESRTDLMIQLMKESDRLNGKCT